MKTIGDRAILAHLSFSEFVAPVPSPLYSEYDPQVFRRE